MPRDSLRPYIWMLMGCVSFTAMYALVHELRNTCDWEIIALFRTVLAFLFSAGLALAWRAKLVLWGPPSLWLRSIAGSVSLLCGFFAMTRNVPVSNVVAVSNVFPIWVALFAWPMLGMKPSRSIILSVFTAVAGVFLIRVPRVDGTGALFDFQDETTLAMLFALMASICTALAMIGLNRLSWIDTRAVVAHFSGVSMVFCIGAVLASDPHNSLEALADTISLLMLLGVGVAATVGQICLTKAFTSGPPAKVSVVGLTQIVMTLLIDVGLFHEKFTPFNLLGIALVLVPTAWVVLSHRLRARPVEDSRKREDSWAIAGEPPMPSAGC